MKIEFVRPWALWTATVLAVIILVHLRQRRRREAVTAFLPLWVDALRQQRRWRVWLVVRSALSLVLSLLAGTFLVLAAGGPRAVSSAPGTLEMTWVFDTSASMAATDGAGETRLARARRDARRLLGGVAEGTRVMIVGAGAVPRVVIAGTSNTMEVLGAIATLEVVDVRGCLADALDVARARSGEGAEMIVWTDGDQRAGPGLDRRRAQFAALGPLSDDNVGFTDAEFLHPAPGKRAVALTLSNFSSRALSVPIRITLGDREMLRKTMELSPGGRESIACELARSDAGEFVARILRADALAADDVVWIDVPGAAKVQALLSEELATPFLLAAIESVPGFGKDISCRVVPSGEAHQESGSVAFVKVSPTAGERGRWVAFETFPEETSIRRPLVTSTNAAHPLTRGLDFSELRIERAGIFAPASDEEILIETAAGPVALAGERHGERWVRLSFAPEESNLFVLAGFPVFVARCIEMLGTGVAGPAAQIHATGVVVPVPAPGGDGSAKAFLDGRETSVETVAREGETAFGPLHRVGRWRLEAGANAVRVPVNLLDEDESNTAPTVTPTDVVIPAPPETQRRRPLASICAGIGLACLAGQLLLGLASRKLR